MPLFSAINLLMAVQLQIYDNDITSLMCISGYAGTHATSSEAGERVFLFKP